MIRLALDVGRQHRDRPDAGLLGLGSEARMNRPGIADGQLELAPRAAARSTPALAARLRELTEIYGAETGGA